MENEMNVDEQDGLKGKDEYSDKLGDRENKKNLKRSSKVSKSNDKRNRQRFFRKISEEELYNIMTKRQQVQERKVMDVLIKWEMSQSWKNLSSSKVDKKCIL